MCGIVAVLSASHIHSSDRTIARSICDQLHHRGPDSSDISECSEANAVLGHTRLSIIGGISSSQPFRFRNITLSFNGEIYNYRELREELCLLGYSFRTDGDTEVLAICWHHWGKDCLSRLDGMYAFVLTAGNTVYIAIDPFGEKPLFSLSTPHATYICSEAAPLTGLSRARFAPSQEALAFFLSYGFMPYEDSGFPGLKRLQPNTLYTYQNGHHLCQSTILPLSNTYPTSLPSNTSLPHHLVKESLLRSSIRRLRGNSNFSIFLSSGVDSVLTACLISQLTGNKVPAITFSTQNQYDEAEPTIALSRRLGVPLTLVPSAPEDGIDVLDRLFDLYTIPNDNFSGLSIYKLSLTAREYGKVVFTGTGGDEIFLGYNKYLHAYQKKHLHDNLILQKLLTTASYLYPNSLRMRQYRGSMSQRLLFQKNPWLSRHINANDSSTSTSFLEHLRSFDLNYTLPLSYNTSVDHATMRASVEARTIFLSPDLFSLSTLYSPSQHIGVTGKQILREALSHYDLTVSKLPKTGFNSSSHLNVSDYTRYKKYVPAFPELINLIDSNPHHEKVVKTRDRFTILGYAYAKHG